MENLLNNNYAAVVGDIESEFSYSHESYGECFYSFLVKIPRLSESADIICVTISERILCEEEYKTGDRVKITGQFRSYNNYSNVGNKLILTLFAKTMEKANDERYLNEIILNGFLCKEPVYRTTPFGREITDVIIAVNRVFNRSDYIPTICWGKNAVLCRDLPVGANVLIKGRLQSREYTKKLGEDFEIRTAYEVSVGEIEEIS